MRHFIAILSAALLFVACGKGNISVSIALNEEVTITPDYKDVTIPPNIAPLNFQTSLEGATCLLIDDEQGKGFQVHAEDGLFTIPMGKWKELLESNKGKSLTLTVCVAIEIS